MAAATSTPQTNSDKTAAVVVELKGSTAVNVKVGVGVEDTIKNIENVIGGSGADNLTGDDLANILSGGAGNDTLNGGAGLDTLRGGAGNDTYVVDNAGDVVDESVAGSGGADTVQSSIDFSLSTNVENLILTGAAINGTGNGANNVLTGNSGNNVLDGGAGNDTLNGDLGNDKLVGGDGNDTITGGAGNDTLVGGADKDMLDGGAGTDTVDYTGTAAAVVVTLNKATNVTVTVGTAIEDTIRNIENVIGGSAADKLTGDGLANELSGGEGSDTLNGGAGNDTLTGGDGSDIFLFKTALSAALVVNVDQIEDFSVPDDTIQLSKSIFTQLAGLEGSTLDGAAFVEDTAAADADNRIIYDSGTGALSYDADGNGSGAAIQFATLANKPQNLAYTDFVLVA
jgi:Ca2+-binding RTX toxin-like protein